MTEQIAAMVDQPQPVQLCTNGSQTDLRKYQTGDDVILLCLK